MENKTLTDYLEIDRSHYLQTFKRYPLILSHGKGSRVWDMEGNEYVDVLAGIAVNCIGHAHPALIDAITKQASKLIHISNFYLSEPQAQLSKKLSDISGLKRVFFTNSGAESNEGAFKIARKYAHSIGRGGEILSFTGSFHGRTLATIATGKDSMKKGFEPIPEGFYTANFNDIESVKALTTRETAAIIIEPIQGEGGIHTADKSFLEELRRFCDSNEIVLIFDEIQCGIGRTGKFFAKEHFSVQPDIITLAKALGGGMPIGAILSSEKVSSAIEFGDHGTTFGGNPLACAAALATLDVIEKENLLREAQDKGEWLRSAIKELNHPNIVNIRGLGLMLGVEFNFETGPLVSSLLKKGVLANSTAGSVLRMVPALNIQKADLEFVIQKLVEALKEYK